MLRCDVTVHRDTDLVAAFGLELFERYAPLESGELDEATRAMVLAQAPKRVALAVPRPLDRDLGSPQARRWGLLGPR